MIVGWGVGVPAKPAPTTRTEVAWRDFLRGVMLAPSPARCQRLWKLELGPVDVEAQARSLGAGRHVSIIDSYIRNAIVVVVFSIVIVCFILLWVWFLRVVVLLRMVLSMIVVFDQFWCQI